MAEETKEKPENKKKPRKRLLNVKDGKITRMNPHCPKCGPGTFLAVHNNRKHCGTCQYAEFDK